MNLKPSTVQWMLTNSYGALGITRRVYGEPRVVLVRVM